MKFKLLISSGLLPENQFHKDNTEPLYPEDNSYNREEINNIFNNLTSKIVVDKSIDHWNILLQVYVGGCSECKEIVFFTRGITYPSDKEKYISIIIPLFTSDNVVWGIKDKRRYLHKEKKYDKRYCEEVSFDYKKYHSLEDYLGNVLKYSIQYIFEKGITLKGKKIKL